MDDFPRSPPPVPDTKLLSTLFVSNLTLISLQQWRSIVLPPQTQSFYGFQLVTNFDTRLPLKGESFTKNRVCIDWKREAELFANECCHGDSTNRWHMGNTSALGSAYMHMQERSLSVPQPMYSNIPCTLILTCKKNPGKWSMKNCLFQKSKFPNWYTFWEHAIVID